MDDPVVIGEYRHLERLASSIDWVSTQTLPTERILDITRVHNVVTGVVGLTVLLQHGRVRSFNDARLDPPARVFKD